MDRKYLKRFLTATTIFLSPIISLLVYYFISDPFKVLRSYEQYYESGKPTYVIYDRDYISTTTFDKQQEKYKYNSFIFGNSRSIFYEVKDWKEHLEPQASCFHFDASGESIYGIERKVKYVAKSGAVMKNVLLVLDYSVLEHAKNGEDHITAVAPQLEGWKAYIPFQLKFIKTYLNGRFLKGYLDLKISGKFKPYMKEEKLLDDRPIGYRPENNELFSPLEDLILQGNYYTSERMFVFYKRDSVQQFSNPVIHSRQKELLTSIQEVFVKNNTDYKVIINPLYDQMKLDPTDMTYLRSLFGKERIFDFAGINEMTNDYHNYYENSHYRPHIAREVMRCIYVSQSNN